MCCLSAQVIEIDNYDIANEGSRRLALQNDWFTKENVQTVYGNIPRTSCPPGSYRPKVVDKHVVSQRVDGCRPCPRGRYASEAGLVGLPTVCAACPLGTYNDKVGRAHVEDCLQCPTGTFGSSTGLTAAHCSGRCPKGTYSDIPGLASVKACKACPPGYNGWQCKEDVLTTVV